PKGSATAKAASHLIAVQPVMAEVKTVIGCSTREMVAQAPQSSLSNWFVDNIMEGVSALSGRKIDFGVGNFGGIRTSMPEGPVILDDMMSMFPFKNQVVYLELQGRDIRAILESMAATRLQALGGCKIVIKDGKLLSAELDGAPIDDDRWYSVATISFLLEGGDNLYLARNSRNLVSYDVDIIDIMLDKVRKLTEAGQAIEYHTDDRVTVL
ncbi:MAG: 5'-nucleotidase C-terminal domain-containing protein, partial [Candidatus Cryptobacteroides sp.]